MLSVTANNTVPVRQHSKATCIPVGHIASNADGQQVKYMKIKFCEYLCAKNYAQCVLYLLPELDAEPCRGIPYEPFESEVSGSEVRRAIRLNISQIPLLSNLR